MNGHEGHGAGPVAPEHGAHAHQQHATTRDTHGGHDRHAGHSVGMFRDRFWISLLLTLPTLVWGHMLQRGLGYAAPAFPGSGWIPALFGTAVFVYGGVPFLRGGIGELKHRLPGMMTLMSLAISVAFAFSAAVTLGFPGMPLWEELATLVTIMLLGHWIEMRSISQAQGALRELAKLLPNTGQVGFRNSPAYVAAKHGVVGLTQNGALEYGLQRIRVKPVGPGFTKTPLVEKSMTPEALKALEGMHARAPWRIRRGGEVGAMAQLRSRVVRYRRLLRRRWRLPGAVSSCSHTPRVTGVL